MASWDYRVVRKRNEEGESVFGVHEIFFDDEGRAWQCTEDPVAPTGATMADLRRVFIGFAGSLFHADESHEPDCGCILDYDLIPQEGAESPLDKLVIEQIEGTEVTIFDWSEIRTRWLEAAKDSNCATCVHWRPVPFSRVLASGRCMTRPLGVRDKKFNQVRRYARTRADDWCNVWAERG